MTPPAPRMPRPRPPLLRLALLALSPLAAHAADDLVRNGGFEQDANRDGAADFWFVHQSADPNAPRGGATVWINDGTAPEGRAFLRVSKTGGSLPHSVNHIVAAARLASPPSLRDAPLRLRALVRPHELSGPATVVLRIFRRGENDTARFVAAISAQPPVTGGDDWRQVETTLRLGDILAPGDTLHRLEVALVVSSNTGHADFDAVSLTPID